MNPPGVARTALALLSLLVVSSSLACRTEAPVAAASGSRLYPDQLADLARGESLVYQAEHRGQSNGSLPNGYLLFSLVNQRFGLGSCLASPREASGAVPDSLSAGQAQCLVLWWLELRGLEGFFERAGLSLTPRELRQAKDQVIRALGILGVETRALPEFFLRHAYTWYASTTKLQAYASAAIAAMSREDLERELGPALGRTCMTAYAFPNFSAAAAFEMSGRPRPLRVVHLPCSSVIGPDQSGASGPAGLYYWVPVGGLAPPIRTEEGEQWLVFRIDRREPSAAVIPGSGQELLAYPGSLSLVAGFAERILVESVKEASPYVNSAYGRIVLVGPTLQVCTPAPPPYTNPPSAASSKSPLAASAGPHGMTCPSQ